MEGLKQVISYCGCQMGGCKSCFSCPPGRGVRQEQSGKFYDSMANIVNYGAHEAGESAPY